MKEPQLGSQLKGRAGDLNRASPYGRWPVALLRTQLKQPKTLLGYSTHAHWTCSSLQHSWSDGQTAKNMHCGTNILSDAHASLHTENNHERWRLSTTQLTHNPRLSRNVLCFAIKLNVVK